MIEVKCKNSRSSPSWSTSIQNDLVGRSKLTFFLYLVAEVLATFHPTLLFLRTSSYATDEKANMALKYLAAAEDDAMAMICDRIFDVHSFCC